ncbi:MAG: oligopeptide/dipeptide transporter, ATPase subunit [Naasia sp.]|jgi:peptide/nickel transport system ATP-binding protein|uniref:ABC transporter ATP-binding protein n=1 Tax=Naasia sp. TaxID=2546198 RepID=UPI00261F86D9|nr:ABC transporter ATP-binding protein [Naasia sp.]MCU1571907.1 oligopeptide/dipeptide transporter, ATPase subunit [Naasia sp.]
MIEIKPLISVENLTVEFPVRGSAVRAVDDVSFEVGHGEIVGLVGESASGKSTLGLSLMRMVPSPGRVRARRMEFDGRDLSALDESQLRQIRGSEISLIVQDALATMNPVTTVLEQITEVVRDHEGVRSRRVLRARAAQALRDVQLPDVEINLRRYPHELSGGMQQRVAIAQGLILGPKLIIADEPTTALDVTVQAQILSLLKQIRDGGTSIIFVTHDLATVAEICDRVLVMYAGRIVESGTVAEVFAEPQHPYTQGLLASLLPLGGDPPKRLDAISGQPPRPEAWPSGCRFHPRCPLWKSKGEPEICVNEDPQPDESRTHWAACHFAGEGVR